jgi:S1-C subfamily serine protease
MDIAIGRIAADLDGNPVDPDSLDLPTVQLGDSDELQLGDTLIILGYPGIGGDTITLTRGEVAGFSSDSEHGNRAFIKTSATMTGGNSGGLAANANGELIGVPTQLGYGGEDQFVDCRVLADTNRDGVVDDEDNCVPTGGFINALRPIKLVLPYIDAARRGETNVSRLSPNSGSSRCRNCSVQWEKI